MPFQSLLTKKFNLNFHKIRATYTQIAKLKTNKQKKQFESCIKQQEEKIKNLKRQHLKNNSKQTRKIVLKQPTNAILRPLPT